MTKQDLLNLVQTIKQKQEDLNKELNVIEYSDHWAAAARRARLISVELGKLYKQYRTESVALAKEIKTND